MTHKPQHDPTSPSPADANPNTDCVEPREFDDELGTGIPQPGEFWVKRSYPIPTIVKIESADVGEVTILYGRRVTITMSDFLSQGFVRYETRTQLSSQLKGQS